MAAAGQPFWPATLVVARVGVRHLGLGLGMWPLLATFGVLARGQAPPRAVRNDQQVVRESGTVPQALRRAVDLGRAPDGLRLNRMLLLLRRSPQQALELEQLIEDQLTPEAAAYHHWLSPEEFGEQFGPALADIRTVTAWLEQEGFSVGRVSAGRTVIEFSGTAGAVAAAFQTEVRRYLAR
ncbi:MAG: protease pro-enzyme activation domain-containing protein [Terriglobales bacterium]